MTSDRHGSREQEPAFYDKLLDSAAAPLHRTAAAALLPIVEAYPAVRQRSKETLQRAQAYLGDSRVKTLACFAAAGMVLGAAVVILLRSRHSRK